MTTRKLSPIKENSGEKKTFKRKYTVKTSQTDPKALLKKNIKVLLTSSDYDRRTKKAPKIDGHGNKTRLPLGRKSRKKNKRKSRKKKKRKSRKKKKRKLRKNRNIFGKGSNYNTELWEDLEEAIKNSRTEYIYRIWKELKDPTAPRKPGCETYYDKNRSYKVEISKEGKYLKFKFIDDFIKPDELSMECKLQEEQFLTQDEYEFATKTGKYYHETGYNQFMTIKEGRGYDIFWASEH